jgi:hypothetical protein
MAIGEYPFYVVKNPGAITASTIGLAYAPTLDGLGLTSADIGLTVPDNNGSGPWLRHDTEPATGKSAGMITTFDVIAGLWLPEAEFVVRTPSTLADLRLWIGMFASLPDGLTAGSTGVLLAAFHFDLEVSPKWLGVVSNGGTPGSAPSDNDVAPNTTYTLKIVVLSPRVLFSVDGAEPPKQVNLVPVTTGATTPEPMGLGIRVTAKSNASRSILWRRASWRLPLP